MKDLATLLTQSVKNELNDYVSMYALISDCNSATDFMNLSYADLCNEYEDKEEIICALCDFIFEELSYSNMSDFILESTSEILSDVVYTYVSDNFDNFMNEWHK